MVATLLEIRGMKRTFRQFLAPLSAGVVTILMVLTVFYLLTLVCVLTKTWSLFSWLGLQGEGFWHGKLWTIVTYALIPATVLDALFNWIMILVLGSWLERAWSRNQMWLLCLTSTLGVGLLYILVKSSSPLFLVGTTPVVFGFVAAWGWLCGHERILFWFMWEMSVRQAAILMTIITWLAMAFGCVGPVIATIMLGGSAAGLAHIWLHLRLVGARPSRTVDSERMGRLEL